MGDQRVGPGAYPGDPGYETLRTERDEARDAWAKANAECCELKTEVEQLRAERDDYKVGAGVEARFGDDARAELTVARRGRRDAILERNEAERRIGAALEYVEKWGENCTGWAAILRGEDG